MTNDNPQNASKMNVQEDAEKLILFFDTETSGFTSDKYNPSAPKTPFVVQFGGVIASKTHIYHEVDVIISPFHTYEDFSGMRWIDPKTMEYHGITQEIAETVGLHESAAAFLIKEMFLKASLHVGHNEKFDQRFIKQLFHRALGQKDITETIFGIPSFCTMRDKETIKFCGLSNIKGHSKVPQLGELYFALFGAEFKNQHSALADARATMRCYFELLDRGIISDE